MCKLFRFPLPVPIVNKVSENGFLEAVAERGGEGAVLRTAMSKGQKIGRKIKIFNETFDEICALLRYYAAYSGNSLPTFRNNLFYHLRSNHLDSRDL